MIILLGKMEIGKKMSKRRDSEELRLNDAQSKEFLGMKYAPGVMHHKTKTREFRVTSYEKVWYDQDVKVPEVYVDGQYDHEETKDLAIQKAQDEGNWGDPEGGEVEEQVSKEIGIDQSN